MVDELMLDILCDFFGSCVFYGEDYVVFFGEYLMVFFEMCFDFSFVNFNMNCLVIFRKKDVVVECFDDFVEGVV